MMERMAANSPLVEEYSYSIVKINNDEHESLRRPETSILK